MKIEFDTLRSEYLDGIMDIEQKCFSVPWSRASFEQELSNALAFYIILIADGVVAGYAGMWKVCGEGHITNVAVLPDFRRQGFGKMLIDGIINEALRSSLEFITLEVRESNIPAQQLYRKFGFEICARRKGYYADNNEDALIMEKVMPPKV